MSLGLKSRVFSSATDGARGYTLIELLLVLTLSGLLLMVAVPRAARILDGVAVRSAAGDVLGTLTFARSLALSGDGPVAVQVDSGTGTLWLRRGGELLHSRGIAHAHGVRMHGSRDSLTYDARGFGRGAANLSIVIQRGAAAETVFVSRLGRVR